MAANSNPNPNNRFLSPPSNSKRTLMATSSDSLSPKRTKPQPIPTTHASLRILCHASLIGAFIGKSGSSIKHLQLTTESKIRVEDSLQLGDLRVISIVAPNSLSKNRENHYEVSVSAAQDAAVRVFEKLLEVSKDINNNNNNNGSTMSETVTFRFLVEGNQAGCVIGKSGKVVEQMKKETGAKIRVLVGNHLPHGVSSPYEVVQIEGEVLAVRKAILGVAGCLQGCSQGEKSSMKESRPLESTSQSMPLDYRLDPPLQRTPISMATTSSSPALTGRPMSFEADRFTTSDSKLQQQEIVFRFLCSNDVVGGVIGRGGSIVRALQDESGASISIGATIADCDERLVTITSKEDVDSRYSPAQRAVVLIYCRSIEAGVEKGVDKGSSVSARLVVPSNQAGCLLGKGGFIISQMRKDTGAGISIFRGDKVPKCVSEDDEVVEISGQFVNVQDALYQVTSRLRNNLLSSKVMNNPGSGINASPKLNGRVGDPPFIGLHQSSSTSQSINRQATIRQGLVPVLHPHRLDNPPSPGLRTSEVAGVNTRSFVNFGRGLTANGGIELGSSNRPPIVTNTTVEILVPESAVSSVYGENGNNLTRIRQISGAKVVVHEPRPGTEDRTVIISGTPDETQAAQSLLHAFILTGPS